MKATVLLLTAAVVVLPIHSGSVQPGTPTSLAGDHKKKKEKDEEKKEDETLLAGDHKKKKEKEEEKKED